MRTSIIIPTKDRPHDLAECFGSILGQSLSPDELMIVDDGDLPSEFIENLKIQAKEKEIDFIYVKKTVRGLCKSRNIAVKQASGDIIFFLDDDVVLDKEYIRHILDIYENDNDNRIGGVQGRIIEHRRNREEDVRDRIWASLEVFFGIRSKRFGKILPSGFGQYHSQDLSGAAEVDFLSGCSSYRSDIFKDFSFDEYYDGYGYREDTDFSFRVSRKHVLIYTPSAKLIHKGSDISRLDEQEVSAQKVRNYFYFFHKNVADKSVMNSLRFSWGMFGLLGIRLIFFAARPRKSRFREIKGILKGYCAIIGGYREAEM